MANAKNELHEILKDRARIKCAKIWHGSYYGGDELPPTFKLLLNYTDSQLEEFYKSLNFEYDSGYGGQNLFGTVWLDDGTWLSRGEYDGSEWWEHNSLPEIPTELITHNNN